MGNIMYILCVLKNKNQVPLQENLITFSEDSK